MNPDVEKAFADLRSDIASRISTPSVSEVARRARRRRRVTQVASAASASAVVVGLSVWLATGPSAHHDVVPIGNLPTPTQQATTTPSTAAPTQTSSPTQTTVAGLEKALPTGYSFDRFAYDAGKLAIAGTTSNAVDAPCVKALVNPSSGEIGPVVTGDCADPAMFGHLLGAVVAGAATNTATVRVRLAGSATPGPVVMTYNDASNTHLVTAYADDGSLWIYDVAAVGGPRALQVSSAGKIETNVAMPQLFRPVVAANADGLWIGNSILGTPGSGTFAALYRVAARGKTATPVLADKSVVTDWLVADHGSVWAGVRTPGEEQETLWRIDAGKPVFHVAEPILFTMNVVGGEGGLWAVLLDKAGQTLNVVRIDPDTGELTTHGKLPLPEGFQSNAGMLNEPIAYADGHFLMLDAPRPPGAFGNYAKVLIEG